MNWFSKLRKIINCRRYGHNWKLVAMNVSVFELLGSPTTTYYVKHPHLKDYYIVYGYFCLHCGKVRDASNHEVFDEINKKTVLTEDQYKELTNCCEVTK